jgi:hypothetical protein
LAVFLAMRHKDLDRARMMGLTAISLEPSSVGYRVNMAHILMTMEDPKNAVAVLKYAERLAKTPAEVQEVSDALMCAQTYLEAQSQVEEQRRRMSERDDAEQSMQTGTEPAIPQLKRRPQFVSKGPHRFLVGVLKSVHCDNPELDLTLNANGKLVALHVDNYFKIQFSARGFQPSSDLNPCKDLEDKPAKVEYVESASPSARAQLIAVELHK